MCNTCFSDHLRDVCLGLGVSAMGVSAQRVCLPARGCLPAMGVSAWEMYVCGDVYPRMSAWGVCAQRECLPRRCVSVGCLPGGGVCREGCLSRGFVCLGGCTTPPLWTEWLTDRCKNITFPQLRLRVLQVGPG